MILQRLHPALPAVALLTAALASPLAAQCADGSRPPCRTASVRPAARPTNLPLDDHTWIVLPFENQAHAADLDWLKDASVNLLYMDLSRWSDVHAIDDKRVADYVRELPNAKTGARLTLGDGQEVARRAGAGKLVMGEFLKVGNLTRVTATAYDARTGSRVRAATEQTNVADSLMSIFGKLARGLLDVPPPTGAAVGSGGTANVQALQEYLAGVKALNRFDLAGAKPHFDKALQLDSAFAMAHYKYAIMVGWDTPGVPAIRTHTEAAQRFSATLPPRERGLIAGHLAFTGGDYERATTRFTELVRADSNDVEALYGLADCLYHDTEVVAAGGDTTKLVFRSSWNQSIRLFQRALKLDPSYHLAFAHIMDGLTADQRGPGCRRATPTAPCNEQFMAALRRDGDTLVLQPVSLRFGGALMAAHHEEARRTQARVKNLQQARAAASDWLSSDPGERRARIALGRVELLLGNIDRAEELLSAIPDSGTSSERQQLARDRVEIALKRGRMAQFHRINDSVAASLPNSRPVRVQGSAVRVIAGQMVVYDSVIDAAVTAQGAPPAVAAYLKAARRMAVGAPVPNMAAFERDVSDVMMKVPGIGTLAATNNLLPSYVFGLTVPRAPWPPIDSTHADWRLGPARALARGDTAALRRAVTALEARVVTEAAAGASDDGAGITITESWLALRDSTRALEAIRRMLDVSYLRSSMTSTAGMSALLNGWVWPHAMLLRADLAAARGEKAEAREWYKRWIELWSKADPEFQPLVERVKKSYSAVGGT